MPKSNNSNAFKVIQNQLSITGIWPKENYGKVYSIKIAISWCLGVGICITMWMETIKSITDIGKLSQILYIMVTYTAYVIKLFFFTYNRKKFLLMLQFLKDPVFISYPDDMDHYMAKTIQHSTFISNVYRYLVILCVTLYGIFPILDNKHLLFPFSFELGNYWFLMYLFQLAGEGFSGWNNSCFDTLCASLMGIAAAQLDVLAAKISRISEVARGETDDLDNTDEIAIKRLNQCVKHHLAIIQFIDLIEQIFNVGILFQFLASAIVICNTFFHFVLTPISAETFLLVDYFLLMLMQLFLYCWYGNQIMFKSIQIGEACYRCAWHKCGNKVRKHLFIVMERSKKPLIITALKLSQLSLITFTAVLRWSYSILTLLLKMNYKSSTEG